MRYSSTSQQDKSLPPESPGELPATLPGGRRWTGGGRSGNRKKRAGKGRQWARTRRRPLSRSCAPAHRANRPSAAWLQAEGAGPGRGDRRGSRFSPQLSSWRPPRTRGLGLDGPGDFVCSGRKHSRGFPAEVGRSGEVEEGLRSHPALGPEGLLETG